MHSFQGFRCALYLGFIVSAAASVNATPRDAVAVSHDLASSGRSSPTSALSEVGFRREQGRCTMRDSCGRKSIFGGEIPCPDNGLATRHDDDQEYLDLLGKVCGEDFATTTCCTMGQLEILESSLQQAEPLIALCPACKLNFRHFFCSLTCSPDQSLFLTVTLTQNLTKDGKPTVAVKSIDYAVSNEFGSGFFESCRNVKFGATNGYAMDLIGGGAQDWLTFLHYMGQERALGSPFQIDFPAPAPKPPPVYSSRQESTIAVSASPPPPRPFDDLPLSCNSTDLAVRCACPDCPPTCATLPARLSSRERYERRCRVGKMDCFPFALVIVYAVSLVVAAAWGLYRLATGRNRNWGEGDLDEVDGAIRLAEDEDASLPPAGLDSFDDESTWTRLRRQLSLASLRRGNVKSTKSPRSSAARANHSRSSTDSTVRGANGSQEETDRQVGSRNGRPRGDTGGSDSSPSLGTGGSSRSRSTHAASNSSQSHGVSLVHAEEDTAAQSQPKTYRFNTVLSEFFYRLGWYCASNPFLVLAVSLAVCGVANAGWARFEIETDPVKLWVTPGSEIALEKERFDRAFGPFYRTEQIFFSVAPARSREVDGGDGGGAYDDDAADLAPWSPVDQPVLSYETLQFLLSVEQDIRDLRSTQRNLSLAAVCFAPTSPSPDGVASSPDDCVVESVLGYFQNSLEDVTPEDWAERLDACTSSPVSCLPTFGQPLNPRLVLGGVPDGRRTSEARAAIITYVVSNSLDPQAVERAEEWEASLKGYLRALARPNGEAAQRNLQVNWSVGTSLEEELNAATNTDIPIVVLSYLVMFAYVSVSLGGSASGCIRTIGRLCLLTTAGIISGATWIFRSVQRSLGGGRIRLGEDGPDGGSVRGRSNSLSHSLAAGSLSGLGAYFKRQVLVDSKFLLGLWGIVIVLLSISSSVALCSAAGVKVTLVIAEVIPFLVLAIGVDNVFLISHELDRHNVQARTGQQTSLAENEDEDVRLAPEERVARTMARMGPSILMSASCQTVAFGLGALVGMPAVRNFAIYAAGAVLVNAALQLTVFVSALTIDLRRVEANRIDCFPCFKVASAAPADNAFGVSESILSRFVRTVYAPNLLRPATRVFVLAFFACGFVLSWIGARHVRLGLDQRLALPSSSHLIGYFDAVDAYLDVGPPVYFVVEGLNSTARPNVRKLCARFSTCEQLSVANTLEAERKRPEVSYLAEPPAVWIDDFIAWTNPTLEDCCRVRRASPIEFCSPADSDALCKPCFEDHEPAWSTTLDGLPEDGEMMRYVRHWLRSPTDEACPLGGTASYSTALSLSSSGEDIEASHFRTYHSPLKTQDDFIEALAAAKRISSELSRRTGAAVYPYSLFYVFFASYSTIWSTARAVLTLALIAVWLFASIFLGSIRTAGLVTLTVFLTLFSVVGVTGVWDVSLNPLSLVNLVISVGIAVEFSAHISRAFMGSTEGGLPVPLSKTRHDRTVRTARALDAVGASTISGIGATKLIGIAVLFFTQSRLLRTYYAKVWLATIVSSAVHGLVLLPVLLSLYGSPGYALTTRDGDGDWIIGSVERRYASRPYEDDLDSLDSDEA